jgi:hypothetical protein
MKSGMVFLSRPISVIASEAKQSKEQQVKDWIASLRSQ